MDETHNFTILKQEIFNLSVEKIDWEKAKDEWELEDIEISSVPKTCLCTHTPICELCLLRNKLNKNPATVGNICVKNFLGINSSNAFVGLKRIVEDSVANTNDELAKIAHANNVISDREFNFCVDTSKKHKSTLSPKQAKWKMAINNKIIRHYNSNLGTTSIPEDDIKETSLFSSYDDFNGENIQCPICKDWFRPITVYNNFGNCPNINCRQ